MASTKRGRNSQPSISRRRVVRVRSSICSDMSEPTACLSLVTLGVGDLAKRTAFYEALGFRRKSRGADGVAFFEAGGVILSLWPTVELARDAEIAFANPSDL